MCINLLIIFITSDLQLLPHFCKIPQKLDFVYIVAMF